MRQIADTIIQISSKRYMCTIKRSVITKLKDTLYYMENQRTIDRNHVNKMIEYQNNYYKNHKEYFLPNPIIIGILNNKNYILDGQHRIETFKNIKNECNIPCSVIHTDTKEELDYYLKLINSNKPYVQVKNNEIKKIENYLLNNYKNYSRVSQEPRIPHFNSNNVVNILNKEYKDITIDADIFIRNIKSLNKYIKIHYKDMGISETHYNLCINKDKVDNPYYIGCIPHNRWIYAISSEEMTSTHFNNIDFLSYPYKSTRKSIPKKLRELLWNNYHKNNIQGSCYVCECSIKNTDFDCGHVIPVHRDGKNSIDNLRCICRSCNNDMGTKHLYDYKKEFEKGL